MDFVGKFSTRWTVATVVAFSQSLNFLRPSMHPLYCCLRVHPTQPFRAISIKTTGERRDPILEGEIPIWAEFWEGNAKSSKNAKRPEKLADLAKICRLL